jgi:hypothetical protein
MTMTANTRGIRELGLPEEEEATGLDLDLRGTTGVRVGLGAGLSCK